MDRKTLARPLVLVLSCLLSIEAVSLAGEPAVCPLVLTRLLQLGETRSGAEPQNAGVFEVRLAGDGNSWCHAWPL